MLTADLVAEHGSPLWLVNLEVLRDRWRTISDLWRSAWPDVQIAYAHAANRHPVILGALAQEGAGHCVTSQPEYDVALSLSGGDGSAIVVGGAGVGGELLGKAASDRALVIADGALQLRAAVKAGAPRLGLRVMAGGAGAGPAFFGVPAAEVPGLVRSLRSQGSSLEALAVHLTTAGFSGPAREVRSAMGALVMTWPHSPERYATNARTLASLAVRLGVRAVDIGGGFPPAPDETRYARTVAGALGAMGFEGRVIVEPGRAVVGEAVDLLCRVVAVKRLGDGTPCIAVDAGHELVPGVLWRWPHVDVADGSSDPTQPTMIVGPGTDSYDVLHPAADLPRLGEGRVLILRRVGAYNQTRSSEHAASQAGVAVWDAGRWASASR